MYQTIPTEHDDGAGRRPPPVLQRPGGAPQWVRIGRGTFPFASYSDVSAAYRATIERLGLGVSETPICQVLDSTGRVIAEVAYNGRVFAVGADGETDRSIVLYETQGG